MTNKEKENIEAMKTIGYWSDYGGVEVKDFEYGIEDYCICVSHSFRGLSKHRYHRLKIHLSTGKEPREYICILGHKLFLDECLRAGY